MKPLPYTKFAELCGLTLRPGQRAFARVAYDGLDPIDLDPGAERELGQRIFGGVERIPECARSVVAQVKGRDSGGTMLAAYRGDHLSLTLPLGRVGHSELAYWFFGAPKLRLAHIALRFALDTARRVPGLVIEDVTSDGFTLLRHDGRRVRLECFAASRGGDTGRGVPLVGALLDEACFYLDSDTGVVNDTDVFSALVPRLLPGGQILIVSSPWGPSGLLYDEFSRNYGVAA